MHPTEQPEAREHTMTRADQERWARRGREGVEALALPDALRAIVRASLDTPQFGPPENYHHFEGLRMDAHLGAILASADAVAAGTLDYAQVGLPPEETVALRAMLERACSEHAGELTTYAYLHDIKKPDCMNVELADGTQRIFTMDEWERIVADAGGDDARIRDALRAQGIVKIGYRQDAALTGDKDRDHGPEAEGTIRTLAAHDPDVAAFVAAHDLILTGVGAHEMHFQRFPSSTNARAWRDALATVFPPETIDFILTVNFLDIAGSKKADGSSDFSSFRNMLAAQASYGEIAAFATVMPTLERFVGRKPAFLENAMNALLNLESLDAVREQIAEYRKPPEATALTAAQITAVEEHLPAWAHDLALSDAQVAQAREALRDAHYARALGAAGLGKLTGMIKRMLTTRA